MQWQCLMVSRFLFFSLIFHVFISLELLFLRGHFVILDSFYVGGDEDIPRYTYVRCMGTLKNCDQFLMSNEDGLPLRVAQLLGTLKIDPFLKFLDVNREFRCWGRGWGQMSFHLHVVGPT